MKNQHFKNFISLFLMLSLIFSLAACTARAAPPAATESPATEAPLAQPPETSAPAAPAAPEETAAVETAPAETPGPETAPPETPAPAPAGPDLAEQPRVDDDFFADAAFMGNSLARGMELWGKLGTPDYFAITSATVVSVDAMQNFTLENGKACTQLAALCQKQYGKIYLLFGVNECGYATDYFIRLYAEMLDKLAEREPDAEIYIMSLSPITKWKSDSDTVYTEEKVLEFNAALYTLAEERGCWYVDNIDALAGEDGYLPADFARDDGIHPQSDKYPLWAEYLRTHYAPRPDNAAISE